LFIYNSSEAGWYLLFIWPIAALCPTKNVYQTVSIRPVPEKFYHLKLWLAVSAPR